MTFTPPDRYDSTHELVERGNINLRRHGHVRNPNGSISTIRTMSFGTDRGEVLVPTVIGGRRLTPQQAIRRYYLTGEHYGIFRSVAAANQQAQILHNLHQALFVPRRH